MPDIYINRSSIPANTESCDKIVVRSQRRTTSIQSFIDVDVTTSKLQRCFNIVSTLDSQFNSQYIMTLILLNVKIMTSNLQLLQNVDTTTSNLKCFAKVASTFDSWFTPQYIMNVPLATSILR